MNTRNATIAAVAVTLFAAAAMAQSPRYYAPQPVRSPVLFQRHASTIAEGYLRGSADLWRGVGEYNYNTSLALMHREQTRSLALDNQVKATQAYFEKRRINREARAAEKGNPLTAERIQKISQSRTPDRLSVQEYNAAVGKLRWPEALQATRYNNARKAVDGLVERRFTSSQDDAAVRRLAQLMKDDLKLNIRNLPPSDYVEAKGFLTSLQYEMSHPASPSSVVAR